MKKSNRKADKAREKRRSEFEGWRHGVLTQHLISAFCEGLDPAQAAVRADRMLDALDDVENQEIG